MALQVLRTPSPPSHSGSEASCSTPRGPSSRRDVAASLAHPILRHSPSIRSFTPFNNPCATSSLSRPRGPSRPYSDSSDSDDEHSRRSSALPPSSSNPLLPPLFSDHSPPSTPHPDLPIFAAFAALRKPSQAPTVETCFCGAASDDDSIYCSVACGRKDAMEALCADEVGGSHYRRVEREEVKRDQEVKRMKEKKRVDELARLWEREKELERQREKMHAWRYGSSSLPPLHAPVAKRPLPSSLSSFRSISSAHSMVPSLSSSSSHSTAPSLSSSIASSLSSPSTPSFPPTPTCDPFSYSLDPPSFSSLDPPSFSSLDPPSSYSLDPLYSFDPPSPCGTLRPYSTESIYAAYLDQDDIGLAYGEMEEGRDWVPGEMGWGGRELKERVKVGLHQRGKLSFDNLLEIMRA